jgi:hypothetical protein
LWNEWTCVYAAQNGHLDVLQWARQNGCPWDEETCAFAAQNGHLDVLQWARQNGCPWSVSTCAFAAENGHLHVLQWASTMVVLGMKIPALMQLKTVIFT